MNALVIVLLVLVFVGPTMLGALVAFIRVREREFREETARLRLDWGNREEWWQRAHNNALVRHAQATEQAATRHAAEIERLTNLLTIGAPQRKEAVIADREPDPEDRLLRRISEESIAAGTAALLNEYAARGTPVSEEEARDEAISMIMGIPPEPNPNVALLVKDGA